MTTHTPDYGEPWTARTEHHRESHIYILDRRGDYVAVMVGKRWVDDETFAKRLCGCVKACTGLPTAILESSKLVDLVSIAEEARTALHAVWCLIQRDYEASPDTGLVVTPDVDREWGLVCDAIAKIDAFLSELPVQADAEKADG